MAHPAILRHDIRVIRGDTFTKDVALTIGFDDIRDEPYTARMVFREAQHDELPELLALPATPEVPEEDEEAFAYLSFSASPIQTQALPEYDIAYFVELVSATRTMRLFQGKACIVD